MNAHQRWLEAGYEAAAIGEERFESRVEMARDGITWQLIESIKVGKSTEAQIVDLNAEVEGCMTTEVMSKIYALALNGSYEAAGKEFTEVIKAAIFTLADYKAIHEVENA